MPSKRSRRKASRSQKRDIINQSIADAGRLASQKRGIQAAANKTLFVEDKVLEKPASIENLSSFKKEKRKQVLEQFKDGLDRTREKVMRPDLTEVCVTPSFKPAKSLEQKKLDQMTRELKLSSSTKTTTTTTEQTNPKKRKASTALISFWDDNEVKKKKENDEKLMKESFISDVLAKKGKIETLVEEAKRKRVKKPVKRARVVLPLAGQSYNPDPEEHKRVLELAHLQEARLAVKAEQIAEALTVRDEEELAAHGIDELDGLIARERPIEPQDPTTIQYPQQPPRIKRPKLSKKKTIGIALNKRNELKRLMKQRAVVETKHIPSIAQSLAERSSRVQQMREMKKRIREEKIRVQMELETLPVKGVIDVQLGHEITGSLRTQNNNSWSLWYDRLGAHHRSKVVQIESLKKGNIRYNSLVVE